MSALWIVIIVYTILVTIAAIGLELWELQNRRNEQRDFDRIKGKDPDSILSVLLPQQRKKLSADRPKDEDYLRALGQIPFPLQKCVEDNEARIELEKLLLNIAREIEKTTGEDNTSRAELK